MEFARGITRGLNELKCRKSKRASRLRIKIEQRLLELGSDGQRGGWRRPENENPGMLFAQVGLHPSAPEFLVKAARKAYRSYLHPDRYPAEQKKEMEEKFKSADNIFDRIEKMSGLAK